MYGIALDKDIRYLCASLRFFRQNEYHVTRFCSEDVMLLVFEGTLRFTEDGKEYEVSSGQYHIQHHGSYQSASLPSDSPGYLYVHFYADWSDNGITLPQRGNFSYNAMEEIIKKLDHLCHNGNLMIAQTAAFYNILDSLYLTSSERENSVGNEIAEYISQNLTASLSLDDLAEKFHFSRNHIINIFKKEYGLTPFEYARNLQISRAKRLLEVTSDTAERISVECGFTDYAHFYKTFRRIEGISPKEWRKLKRISQ